MENMKSRQSKDSNESRAITEMLVVGLNRHIMDLLKIYGRLMKREMFNEIEAELAQHKFNTDMHGRDIVPKLIATMELMRSKLDKEGK